MRAGGDAAASGSPVRGPRRPPSRPWPRARDHAHGAQCPLPAACSFRPFFSSPRASGRSFNRRSIHRVSLFPAATTATPPLAIGRQNHLAPLVAIDNSTTHTLSLPRTHTHTHTLTLDFSLANAPSFDPRYQSEIRAREETIGVQASGLKVDLERRSTRDSSTHLCARATAAAAAAVGASRLLRFFLA